MEPIKVQGKTELLEVYKVLSAREKREPISFYPGLKSIFIGRNKEISQLEQCIESLIKGDRGGIIHIIGEAGIGKSRLVSEYKNQLMERDLSWLEGRALPYGQDISYGKGVKA